jgi:hypothetical protein
LGGLLDGDHRIPSSGAGEVIDREMPPTYGGERGFWIPPLGAGGWRLGLFG